MNRYLLSFLFLAGAVCAIAQDLPPREETPNYILRNNDFLDKRETPNAVNQAKEYYSSHAVSNQLTTKSKKTATWIPKGPFGKEDLAGMGRVNSMQFHPTDTNTWYICVAQGGIWKTTNAGASWISISGDLPILRTSYLSVHPTDPNIMYVALGDYAYLGHNLQANENKRSSHYGLGIYKTTNGGSTWSATGLSFAQTDFEGSLIAKVIIHHANTDKILAVGQTGCYLSNDAGVTFTKTRDGLFWDLEQHPTDSNVLFASTGYVHSYKTGEVAILKSTDFGATWAASITNIPATGVAQRVELAISPSDPDYVYAIACDTLGGFYGFYRSTNGGTSFATRRDNTYEYNILNWNLNSEPGGQGRYDLAISVDRNDLNKVLIGGVNIWQTTNGGNSFKPITYWLLNYYDQSLHADIHEIIQHPTNNTYFACHDGGISRTFNVIADEITQLKDDYTAQTEWTNYIDGLNIMSFYRLSINEENPNEMMAGAQDNSTSYSDGNIFYNISGGDGMESEFADEVYIRYSSSQNGRINAFSSFGGGFSFENTISTPEGERAEWTTPFTMADGQLYIGYSNVYTAVDGYLSEQLSLSDNVPITALDVEKSNGSRIYYAKRGYSSQNIQNRIATSANNGSTWTDISTGLPRNLYPGYIEMNQENPSEVWICFPSFDADKKVYHSTDAGATWANITYDLPNIPVNCITQQTDGSNLIYVGTDLGVYALYPDSTNWVFYSEGLPNVIVNELEINVTEKTLVAATFGRGLWAVDLIEAPMDSSNVSVRDLAKEFTIILTPNPVSNTLTITTKQDIRNINLQIIDVTGKTVHEVDYSTLPKRTHLDLSKLITGHYYLLLQTEEGKLIHKFLKE